MIRRVCSALLVVGALAAATAPATAKDVFKEAPDVTFRTVDGASVHVADLKGKVVLVDFWASWCIPCRKSFPAIEQLHHDFESKGLVVIAVSVDEESKNADLFLSKYPHTMRVALDPKGTAAEAFKVNAMPSTMIIDRSGHVRYTHKGYTDKTVATFRSQVIELLAEAQ
ncbi:MAG: TlpA family protein disulfide reductase [Acidobacteria bacterium]|nr:TlpA family protein disulfide reductase [Acidobacteriota bacterium]